MDIETAKKIIGVEHDALMKAWTLIQLHEPQCYQYEDECCGRIDEWSCTECKWTGYSGEGFMKHLQELAGLKPA